MAADPNATFQTHTILEKTHAFRHLLEAMKNWGGKELIELKPYQAPAMRVIEPPQDAAAISGRAGLSPRASVWLGVFGAITAVMVGGYLYLARPVGETSKVAQEPIFTESSPSSAKSSMSQEIPEVQQPDTWKGNLQVRRYHTGAFVSRRKALGSKTPR